MLTLISESFNKKHSEGEMDYEFLRDVTSQVIVRFSMGHKTIAHWINEELNGDFFNLLDRIEDAQVAVKESAYSCLITGHEYTLLINREEVMICAPIS